MRLLPRLLLLFLLAFPAAVLLRGGPGGEGRGVGGPGTAAARDRFPGRTPGEGDRAAPQDPPRLGALCERGPKTLVRGIHVGADLVSLPARTLEPPAPGLCADVSLAPRGRASIHSPRADSLPRRGGSPSFGLLDRPSRSVWTSRLGVQKRPLLLLLVSRCRRVPAG